MSVGPAATLLRRPALVRELKAAVGVGVGVGEVTTTGGGVAGTWLSLGEGRDEGADDVLPLGEGFGVTPGDGPAEGLLAAEGDGVGPGVGTAAQLRKVRPSVNRKLSGPATV
jgi:hypothetical protein